MLCTKFHHDFLGVLDPPWAEFQCNRFLADLLPWCSVLDHEVGELWTWGEGRVAGSFAICSSSVASCDYSQELGKKQHLNAILGHFLTHLGMKFELTSLSLMCRLSILNLIAKLVTFGPGVWGCSLAHSQSPAVATGPATWVRIFAEILGGGAPPRLFGHGGDPELVATRPNLHRSLPRPHII